MKRIVLALTVINGAEVNAVDVLIQFVKAPPAGRGLDLSEMRARLKIMDRLEAAKGAFVDLEDAEHAMLVTVLNATSFGLADRGLLSVIDAVCNATPPPAA